MIARVPDEPRPDLGVLVRGVVVENEMHVEARGHVGVDVSDEGGELLMPMGRLGSVRSSACIRLFSSTPRTSALSGGLKYNPTTSRTFAMKNGSGESWKPLVGCGCAPKRWKYR